MLGRARSRIRAPGGDSFTQHSGDGKANQYSCAVFNLDHGTDFLTNDKPHAE